MKKNLSFVVVMLFSLGAMAMPHAPTSNPVQIAKNYSLTNKVFPVRPPLVITVPVDVTTPITVLGQKCSAHVTGTLTVEIDLIHGTIGLTSQNISVTIDCKKKSTSLNMRQLDYDAASNSCYDVLFDATGDADVNDLLLSLDFKNEVLVNINAYL